MPRPATSLIRKAVSVAVFLLLIPVVAIAAAALSARFGDGPSVVFEGGPLVAGELVRGAEPDWAFARNVGTIDLQLLDPPRSRRIWIAEHEGKIYVVSGYMGNMIGRLWKRWPARAERDGRAIIRIGDKRYRRSLVRIQSGAAVEGVLAELRRKYGFEATPADVTAGRAWLFELAPPTWDANGGEG